MSFEFLANELIFDIFEYFSFVDLFDSFKNLNNRFDNLIITFLKQKQSIDFRLITKENLNLFRRQYLPSIIDRIQTIYLSDQDENPFEIDLFLSRLCPIFRFNHLKSIILSSIYSIEKFHRILNDLKQISSFNSLTLKQSYFPYDPKKFLQIIDQIWSLTNLNECYLDLAFSSKCYLIISTNISSSIEYLTIKGIGCNLEDLSVLYEHTPNLKSLSIELISAIDDDYSQLLLIPSLIRLDLKCNSSSDLIFALLKKTPCLQNLTIQTENLYIDGSKLSFIIENYLVYLKNFHLKLEFENKNEEIDQILNSYQTDFWIKQRQWFIRCFQFQQNDIFHYNLHTLPYHFTDLNINTNENFLFKSTLSNDETYLKYNYVTNLDYSSSIIEKTSLSKFEFNHVKNLALTIFSENSFQFFNYQYENLTTLGIRILDHFYTSQEINQIQTILDQSPNLYHLKFYSWSSVFSKTYKNLPTNDTNMPPFNLQSSSIRSLYLRGIDNDDQKQSYNEQQCLTLVRLPLTNQCEHLTIEVGKRSSIIDLIKKLNHLKTLNVSCQDNKQNKDEIIKWLQARLPTLITFAKDSKDSNEIRLWIR